MAGFCAVPLAITLGVAAVAACAMACDPVRSTAPPDTTTEGEPDLGLPEAPNGGVEVGVTEPLPCRQLATLGPPTSLRGLQVGTGATAYALGNAGQGGGMVPVRLGPDGTATPLLGGEQGGTCRAFALAPGATQGAAVCTHDLAAANADGSDEIIIFDLDGGVPRQLTRRDARFPPSLTSIAIDRAARNVAFLAGGALQVADLSTGERRLLGTFSTSEGPILRLTLDGRFLTMGDTARRSVWLFDLTSPMTTPSPPPPPSAAPPPAPDGGSVDGGVDAGVVDAGVPHAGTAFPREIVAADAFPDGTGRRWVFRSSAPLADGVAIVAPPEPEDPSRVPQLFSWDRETDTWRALTSFGPGTPGPELPRLDEAGHRLAFVSWAPLDNSAPAFPDRRARVVVAELDADGALGNVRLFPFDGNAIELVMATDGGTLWLRRVASGREAVTRFDVATGLARELLAPTSSLSTIDLSSNGGNALVRRVTPTGEILFSRVSLSGVAPEVPVPWAGALDESGTRIAALVDGADVAELRRHLGIFDAVTGESRFVPGALADTTNAGLGPAGAILSANGRWAAYLDASTLVLTDVDLGGRVTVDTRLTQALPSAALDATGTRLVFWRLADPPHVGKAPPAELMLYDRAHGTTRVLVRTGITRDASGPIAISPSGTHVAFCLSLGYDALCRLATIDLDASGAPVALAQTWAGVDVGPALSLDDKGRAIYQGRGPGLAGLLRFDPTRAELERLLPKVTGRAILKGGSCAFNTSEGGAVVAAPALE